MNTLLWIFLVTPWSLVAFLMWKLLHKTRVYGKFWIVTERYLDAFDYTKGDGTQLIVVKQSQGETDEQLDAEPGSDSERTGCEPYAEEGIRHCSRGA